MAEEGSGLHFPRRRPPDIRHHFVIAMSKEGRVNVQKVVIKKCSQASSQKIGTSAAHTRTLLLEVILRKVRKLVLVRTVLLSTNNVTIMRLLTTIAVKIQLHVKNK